MQTNNAYTPNGFLKQWETNSEYFEMLRLMASLSKLFSENTTPYLDYRLAENLFCKYFDAINDARACTAYDARIGNLGIGIKTFGIPKDYSVEKVAEFNKLKKTFVNLHNEDLARKLAECRNDRMNFANDTYDVVNSIYHIVGRKKNELIIFNTAYDFIDIDKISNVKENDTSLCFTDGKDHYTFNKSKSVLMKSFRIPSEHAISFPVDIIDDPLSLLKEMLGNFQDTPALYQVAKVKGRDYIILPLYSTRGGGVKHVPLRSGLNQWNANGRPRNENEVYIPIPKRVHQKYPDFFPDRDVSFDLILPNGDILSAKVCQDSGKALMSNPNSKLGEWILRKLLRKNPGDLVTMEDLERFGVDSVRVEKVSGTEPDSEVQYKISFTDSDYESYEDFITED